MKIHIIAIIGPTSSGKSDLAVSIAKLTNGEILSVDSRQIYKGMDIGTGKVEGKFKKGVYSYKNIPHYGIDITNPTTQFSVSRFQKYAKRIIKDIHKRGKTPILAGGTMHWMDAVIFDQTIPKVKPNLKLRTELEKESPEALFRKLVKLDPKRSNAIDKHNKRRLIRALEIVLATGKPVPEIKKESPYEVTWIGIKPEDEILKSKIKKRLSERLKHGMVKELEKLHKNGLSWKKLESFGLEYKFCSLYLQNKISKTQLEEELYLSIWHYAKRQMTWWKRNKDIKWFENSKTSILEIKKTVMNLMTDHNQQI